MKNLIKTKKEKTTLILAAVLIVFSAFIIFRNLDKNTPLYYDEALYSAKDIEFMKEGQSLFQPKGELQNFYNIKPPLKTWMKYPIYKVFGINTFSIRALDGVMGIITVLLLFLIGKRIFNAWAGFAAGFIFVTFKGLLTDYWARVNGYDSGAILGTVAFFYFFLFYREKKTGWLWCGLSLTFITYFKHISVLLPLAIAVLYLFIEKGFAGLFNRRFILMILIWILPVLAFYIPYAINNETFIGHFFGYEVFTVVTEGTGEHGRGDILYYFKWLFKDLGSWFPVAVASLIGSVILYMKRRQNELLLILLWFVIPFIVLTIAATRINRYLFPSFPAIALLTGYIISISFNSLSSRQSKQSPSKITLPATIFLLLIGVVFIYAGAQALKSTEPFYRENYHCLYDYYKTENTGTLYLTEGNIKRYGWAEKVILHAMNQRCKIMTKENTEAELIVRLGKNDVIVLYNYKIFDLFYSNKTSLLPERYSVVDFALQDSFYSKHKLFRKMILFRKDSPVSDMFISEKITPLPLLERNIFDSVPDEDFINYIYRLSCGNPSAPDSIVKYYSEKMISDSYSRQEIADRFGCYSRWFTSKGITNLIENEADGEDINAYHHYTDFYSPNQNGSIGLVGLRFGNFTPAVKCQMLRTRNRWTLFDRKTDIRSILPKIKGNDTIIMRRSDMIRWLERNDIQKTQFFSIKPESNFSFFSLKKRSGYLRPQTKYFNIVGIVRNDSKIYSYLSKCGIEFLPFKHPKELVDFKEPDDATFIRNTISIIFDCNSEPKFENLYLERLKNNKTTRIALFEMFLKQANELEY
jgi:4-amino-4-deoxy-L-arabinose transferase-like glycosyltransferase